MKISNSKQELARIISENGGWRDGAEWATQDHVVAFFSGGKPKYETYDKTWCANGDDGVFIVAMSVDGKIGGFHNTILSREEYFHLYPAPDADGWIEWDGGDCPVSRVVRGDFKLRCGEVAKDVELSMWNWRHGGSIDIGREIVAYRLHKPEQAGATDKLSSEAVSAAKIALMSDSIEELARKPTIEQLAADYRNKLDYANRKQDEADKANMDSDTALSQLEDAIAAIGFAITPLAATEKEPELAITDWRDLRVGDEVEYVEGSQTWSIGMVGVVQRTDDDDGGDMNVRLLFGEKGSGWPRKWRFIRRP